MKTSGIVRRIDDLGRVVIPKEIRRRLKIREGDPLEVYSEKEGEVVLRKYSPMGEMKNYAEQYVESLAIISDKIVCIADRDEIIAASGIKSKQLLGKKISEEMIHVIDDRRNVIANGDEKKYIKIFDDFEKICNKGYDEVNLYKNQGIFPIISAGDVVGALILLDKNNIDEKDIILANCAVIFIGKMFET